MRFSSRRLLAGILLAAACKGQGLDPAPFKAPEVGTVYHYSDGLTNKVTSADGWRMGFVDNAGAPGSRIGVFISEDPKIPLMVDAAELQTLWPLVLNKEVTINVKRGAEFYAWHFRVPSEENIQVAGRNYPSYVVQAVQTPVLVTSPKKTVSTMNTWWFSPELNAVVRFRTTYMSGPTAGKIFQSTLEGIELPSVQFKADPAKAASGAKKK